MEKTTDSNEMSCRACLTQKRSLRSIFNRDKELSYAEIIGYLANVKIEPNDGYSDKICLICRTKAVEAFEFKHTVQKTDQTLRGHNNFKKLQFNDISDVKLELDCIKSETIIKSEEVPLKFDFNNDEEITYNHVLIKKLTNPEIHDVAFEEFMKNNDIKYVVPDPDYDDGIEDNFFDNDDINEDEYLSAAIRSNSSKKSNRKKKKFSKDADDDYIPHKKPDEKKLREKKLGEKKLKLLGKKKQGRPRKYTYHTDKLSPDELAKNRTDDVLIEPVLLNNYRVLARKPDEETLKMRREKRRLAAIPRRGKEKRICPYCGRICSTNVALSSHILTHEGVARFKCPECPKKYYTAHALKSHSICHQGEKTLQCDQCPLKFYLKCQLNSHKKSHEAVRKFVCDVCSKAFKRLCTMKRHVMRHSSANKNVKCDQCNMSFFEVGQLRHHLRIHTGERPFKCEICSQPYSYKHDYNRHCFNKHGVFMKYRSQRVMTQELLDQERKDVRALFKSNKELVLPTPPLKYPRIIDSAQLSRLFNNNKSVIIKKQ